MNTEADLNNPSPLERIIALWPCFCEEDGGVVIKPIVITNEDQRLDLAFERFAAQTYNEKASLPLFLTLPGQQFPANFPPEFALSLFELEKLKNCVDELRRTGNRKDSTGRTEWWLLEECFPKSFARYWLGKRECATGFQKSDEAWRRVKKLNEALGLEGLDAAKAKNEWEYLIGNDSTRGQSVDPITALVALDGLLEIGGKPGVLFLDDLAGRSEGLASSAHKAWQAKLKEFREIFNVAKPVLPVQARHGKDAEELLPIIRAEIDRLPRPLAAVVDMNWLYADTGERNPLFGLELIKLIRQAKPSLPVFVWSPINDKQTLQRTMQLGAANYFDKEPALSFGHEELGTRDEEEAKEAAATPEEQLRKRKEQQNRRLTPGKLWFHIIEWESTRYRMPPVGKCGESFLLDETRESKDARRKFLKIFRLTEGDLLAEREPDVERLLRALVPDAAQIEILRFFGEGMSGSEPPFVVRGKSRSGRWLRPVQIKLSRDWRALAREGKGYRDVFAGALGPSVAHVESGPYRIGEWCGMAQSFAAPEEAIREIGAKSTRSLVEWLRKKLWMPDECKALVNELFDGVLDPFYKGNLTKRQESVVRAFDRVTPAHLEAAFSPVPENLTPGSAVEIDLTPETLSCQNEKARREMAYREWRKAEEWFRDGDDKPLLVRGLIVDTLEVHRVTPSETRLRLLDRTLGVKVDLKAGCSEVARRWKALAESPIKLRGLPVSFTLDRKTLKKTLGNDAILLGGWERSVGKKMGEGDIKLSPELNRVIDGYFYPCHPLDWSEEFHVGPTHGDLNLGNILLHEKDGSYFPWLIDFDKAEDDRPVVFDLAKLEIEAYHNIGQDLYWELCELIGAGSDELLDLLRDFELCLESGKIEDIGHLWERFEKTKSVPESVQRRFSGFFAYLKQLHKRVENLGVGRREFLIGRTLYCFCCIKFKHLYESKRHPNAPFPAKVLLWKLHALLDALDSENGITDAARGGGHLSRQQRAVGEIVKEVRFARTTNVGKPLQEVVSATFSKPAMMEVRELVNYGGNGKSGTPADWETVFRLLRDRQIPGKGRWFRELLWYARDHGVAEEAKELAEFSLAMVRASQKPGTEIKLDATLKDFASTGRPGNVYPTLQMFKCLADEAKPRFVKMSTRGDSGGTIDILEQAGVPLCESAEVVNRELDTRGWALATTSSDLCEVDKLLWDIRKAANCMKVGDLVIASISAKKIALGIGDFDVQIVRGYDAKFSELLTKHADLEQTRDRWQKVWKEVHEALRGQGGDPSQEHFRLAEPTSGFDSDNLTEWLTKDDDTQPVVFGSAALAAQIWRRIPVWGPQLRMRMPRDFCKKMDDLGKVLAVLEKQADSPSCPSREVILLPNVDSVPHLSGVRCWRTDDIAIGDEDIENVSDIVVVMFRFKHDVRELVRVPFFDQLYSELAKSANPLASVVFAPEWIAVLQPKKAISSDLHAWCWRILRDGFEPTKRA